MRSSRCVRSDGNTALSPIPSNSAVTISAAAHRSVRAAIVATNLLARFRSRFGTRHLGPRNLRSRCLRTRIRCLRTRILRTRNFRPRLDATSVRPLDLSRRFAKRGARLNAVTRFKMRCGSFTHRIRRKVVSRIVVSRIIRARTFDATIWSRRRTAEFALAVLTRSSRARCWSIP
jgi:hypothetical protein